MKKKRFSLRAQDAKPLTIWPPYWNHSRFQIPLLTLFFMFWNFSNLKSVPTFILRCFHFICTVHCPFIFLDQLMKWLKMWEKDSQKRPNFIQLPKFPWQLSNNFPNMAAIIAYSDWSTWNFRLQSKAKHHVLINFRVVPPVIRGNQRVYSSWPLPKCRKFDKVLSFQLCKMDSG